MAAHYRALKDSDRPGCPRVVEELPGKIGRSEGAVGTIEAAESPAQREGLSEVSRDNGAEAGSHTHTRGGKPDWRNARPFLGRHISRRLQSYYRQLCNT